MLCRWFAAAVHGLGHRPADVHQFCVPARRQTTRSDVRLYQAILADDDWRQFGGLLVTSPSRIVADLLDDGEAPEAVARVVADALRVAKGCRRDMADAIASHAVRFGFEQHDGQSLLQWLADLAQKPPQLHPDADDSPCETASGEQFLLIRTTNITPGDAESTTIRIATVMRQGLSPRTRRRRQAT